MLKEFLNSCCVVRDGFFLVLLAGLYFDNAFDTLVFIQGSLIHVSVCFDFAVYGVSHLNLTKSQATRVLNVKLCTGRRAQKKQFERSLEQKLINHPSRNPLK